MAVELNVPVVRSLIDLRFGSVDGLAVEWEFRVSTRLQKTGRARDRATIYRWLTTGIPTSRDDIFGLAAALDVDPIALLNIDNDLISKRFSLERYLFQLGDKSRSRYRPLWELFLPSPHWPNNRVIDAYFGRAWSTFDFKHTADTKTNVYSAISLARSANEDNRIPQVYLFAYRRASAPDKLWRPYGFIRHYADRAQLISENGTFVERPNSCDGKECLVETYFGPGPAEFRIASLHRINATLKVPSDDPAALRFPA